MKICWIDCETTGLDERKHGIIQLSWIIDIDGKIVDTGDLHIQPFDNDEIDDDALQITGNTIETITSFMNPKDAYNEFISCLKKYVNPFEKDKPITSKFYVGGHNVDFDVRFLKEFFKKCNDSYFSSYFNYRTIDTLKITDFIEFMGVDFGKSHKLEALANLFEIPIKAHDSMSDVITSREIAYRYRNTFCLKGFQNENNG